MTRRLTSLPTVDPDDDVRLLDLKEVGERLCVTERTVRRRIANGDLIAVIEGDGEGQMRVRLPDLKAYIQDLPTVRSRRSA